LYLIESGKIEEGIGSHDLRNTVDGKGKAIQGM